MANLNAEQNALATTTDSGEQGDVNDTNAAVAPSSTATDTPDGTSTVEETSPDAGQSSAPQSAPAPQRIQGELVDALQPVGDNSGEQKEVANGRPYEIVFIVRTSHGNDIEAITGRVRALVDGAQGAIDNVRTSDVRRFSYPIDKEAEGSYVVVNGRFATGVVTELDRFFKLEEGVLRHMIVREDI